MFCQACGEEIPPEAMFCSRCGKRLLTDPAPRISSAAAASLGLAVLGLIPFCGTCCLAPLAILCGCFGLRAVRRARGRLTGRNIAVAGIVVAFISLLEFSLLQRWFDRVTAESRLEVLHHDMQVAAEGIDDYRRDHNQAIPSSMSDLIEVDYLLGSIRRDPFAGSRWFTWPFPDPILYYQPGVGGEWVLHSPGPDRKWDIPRGKFPLGAPDLPATIAPLTYDPTNGLTSSGDIWRTNRHRSPSLDAFH